MKSLLSVVVAAIVVLASPTGAEAQVRTEQVRFKTGQTSASVTGTIKGEQIVDYTLRAGAGQSMVVKFKSSHPSAYFNVLPPGQDAAIHIGSTAGSVFAAELAAGGTYTLRVYLMRSAARRQEQASYTLEVGITGSPKGPVAAGAAAAPRAVPSRWDASGDVRCSAGSDKLDRQCGFRVLRSVARKSAEVWIASAAGAHAGYRYLSFENNAFATDDAAKLAWQRQSDNWVLSVDAREFYLIPDALLFGG